MDEETLLMWCQKIYQLNLRYSHEKEEYVNKFLRSFGIKKVLFSKDISETDLLPEFIRFMEGNQLTLYNNMVNYSNIAAGFLQKNDAQSFDNEYSAVVSEIKKLLQSYMFMGSKIREEIIIQLNALKSRTTGNKSTSFVGQMVSSFERESILLNNLRRDAQAMKNNTDTFVKHIFKLYSQAQSSAYDLAQFIRGHQTTIIRLEAACVVVSGICLAAGIDAGDVLTDVRRLLSLLKT